ncbi:MAG TPA: DUF4255 domain-containing protein [Amoebophilaceae bacterium]|nr:DUF4255 domain-containing protein [Amoebophilaceae bacterium]
MFHHCTNILLTELNHYIQSKMDLPGPFVSTAMISNSRIESKYPNGIGMHLVDIVPVPLRTNSNEYVPHEGGFVVRKLPEAFSLYFLFSIANIPSDFLKNLELLAHVAACFQQKSHFDQQNTPSVQEYGMESFSVELVKMSASEKSKFWRSLQAPYSPSLLYKVGVLFVEETATKSVPKVSAFRWFHK